MRDIREATLGDIFCEHVGVLLRNEALDPRERIQQVIAACKELETATVMPPRRTGRPTLGEKALERARDPFLVPLLVLLRRKAQEDGQKALTDGVKALRAAGDSASQYAADLMEHGAPMEG